ncbi:MAG: nucleotidyltransferase domain-containing protein [Acidimicrobiia bacterium]
MADLGEWRPYSVERVASLMADVTDDWWLSGGEALDRFVGRHTRAHGDVDVSVPTAAGPEVVDTLLRDHDVRIAAQGALHRIDDPAAVASVHNLWVRDVGGGPWRWQVNLEPCDATTWTYRRDPRVTRPRRLAVIMLDGMPCTAPAVQLLWKSARPESKDDLDRAVVEPMLPTAEREWLVAAIQLAHPMSPWRPRA